MLPVMTGFAQIPLFALPEPFFGVYIVVASRPSTSNVAYFSLADRCVLRYVAGIHGSSSHPDEMPLRRERCLCMHFARKRFGDTTYIACSRPCLPCRFYALMSFTGQAVAGDVSAVIYNESYSNFAFLTTATGQI